MPMLFRPQRLAAMFVDAVPMNGSSTVSPTKLNMRINRSASSIGYGAGWSLVEAPVKPCQICWNQARCCSSGEYAEDAGGDGRLAVTTGLPLHQDKLDVVFDDRVWLIGFAQEPGTVASTS